MAIYIQTDWASDNCPVCMNPLPINATGRPPVHCSNACKQKSYRQRNNVLRNSEPVQKTTRNSRKKATVTYIGESGTVHHTSPPNSDGTFPSSLKDDDLSTSDLRTFADLLNYFAG
jgi:hypothetical protein